MVHRKITAQLNDDLDYLESHSKPLYDFEEGSGLRPYAEKVHAERLSLEAHIRREVGATKAAKSMRSKR